MSQIILHTFINAPVTRVFDISLSVDVHIDSMKHTKEKVIAGRKNGVCLHGDEITWQARHLGVSQQMTVKIVSVQRPHSFEDKMIKGPFKSMHHRHLFEEKASITNMIDEFNYEVPFGLVGALFDKLYLKKYMTRLLQTRNSTVKKLAENPNYTIFP